MDNLTRLATDALADCYQEILAEAADFAEFEQRAMQIGFEVMSSAMPAALQRRDDELADRRPAGCTVHDRKDRTVLAECGQVSFTRRVYRDAHGRQFALLDEILGLKPRARISPGAFEMVLADVMCDSFGRAAEILCRHTRCSLSKVAVQAIVRQAGADALA